MGEKQFIRLNMRLLSIFVCVLLSIGEMNAQNVAVSSSNELVNESSTTFFSSFLGLNDNGYYMFRKGGPITNEELLVELYSTGFKLLSSVRIKSAEGVMGDGITHYQTFMVNGSIYHLYKGWKKKEGNSSLMIFASNEDGSPVEQSIQLEQISAPSLMNGPDYTIKCSPDGRKMAVFTEKPFVKGGKEEMRVQVFSTKDFSSLWFKDITLEFESTKNPTNDFTINNDGVIGLFKVHSEGRKEKKFFWITIEGDVLQQENLNFAGAMPLQVDFRINNAGEFFCFGTTAELGWSSNPWQGTFQLRASKEGKLENLSLNSIDHSVYEQVSGRKLGGDGIAKLDDFVLIDAHVASSNGLYIVLEKQKITKTDLSTPAQPFVYSYEHRFGDIVVISMDENGTVLWNSVFKKNQIEATPNPEATFCSVVSIFRNDKIHFIWNYTAFEREAITAKRFWMDNNRAKIYVDQVFGKEAFLPTFFTVIDAQGNIENQDKTFMSIPLTNIQQTNAYPMAIDPSFWVQTNDGVVILSRMPVPAKRYKFSTIKF